MQVFKTIPAQISASFQMKRHFAMRRLPQALLGRQWMPWGISTMRWDPSWFPTWFAMLSCQHRFGTVCKHVAQDFRSGMLVHFITQENTSVLGAVKVFWGRGGIISPAKTAAYIRQHVHRKICQSSIAVLMQFIRIFMSQNAAWKARSMNLVESSSQGGVGEWFPDVEGTECCPRKCGNNKKLALVTSQTQKYMRGCCVTTSDNYVMSKLCLG